MNRDMKGITPVIATIILLLITVAIAGGAWTYITGYWSGTVDKQIEVTDAFCVGTDQAKIIVRNIGTSPLDTKEIKLLNRTSGTDLSDSVIWTSQVSPPDSGMVMHLKFDEGSGIYVWDSAGDNNGTFENGTCSPGTGACPNWAPGKMGWALDFDGNDYVKTGYNGPNDTEIAGHSLTVSVWIRPSTLTGAGTVMMKNGPIYLYRSGNVIVGAVHTAYIYWPIATGAIPLTTEWNHVAMTYDNTSVRLYVNGVADTSVAAAGGDLSGNGCTSIGRYNNANCDGNPQNYFQGRIDDLRIYNRVLSIDEIKALAGVVMMDPGGTATLTNTCSGRCSYNIIVSGRSRQASVDCS